VGDEMEEKKFCGEELRKYLSDRGLTNRNIDAIMDGIHSREWQYTYLVVSHSTTGGVVLDWDQVNESIARNPEVLKRIVLDMTMKYRRSFKVELWENIAPNCMVFVNSRNALGLLAPNSRGFW